MGMGYHNQDDESRPYRDLGRESNPFKPHGGHYSDEATLTLQLIEEQKQTNELLKQIVSIMKRWE